MKHGKHHRQGGRPPHILDESKNLQTRENAQASQDLASKTELMELASHRKRSQRNK